MAPQTPTTGKPDARQVKPWQLWTLGGIAGAVVVQALLDWFGVISIADMMDAALSSIQDGFERLGWALVWAFQIASSAAPLLAILVAIVRLAVPLIQLAVSPLFLLVAMFDIFMADPAETSKIIANGFIVSFFVILALQRCLAEEYTPIVVAGRARDALYNGAVLVYECLSGLCVAVVLIFYLDKIFEDAALLLSPVTWCVRRVWKAVRWGLGKARKHWVLTTIMVSIMGIVASAVFQAVLVVSAALVAECGQYPTDGCFNAYIRRNVGFDVS